VKTEERYVRKKQERALEGVEERRKRKLSKNPALSELKHKFLTYLGCIKSSGSSCATETEI
jgi:hypothetical protein